MHWRYSSLALSHQYGHHTDVTRTTRTPAFWGYPPPPHDYPYHWVILDPKSEEDKVKVTNLKISPKLDVQIWNGSDEYCWRYRADTILSTDGQMDRWTDGQGETSIPPFQLCWSGGYNNIFCSGTQREGVPHHMPDCWHGQPTPPRSRTQPRESRRLNLRETKSLKNTRNTDHWLTNTDQETRTTN